MTALILTGTKKRKKVAFANRIDPKEEAHNEPPHLDLHCLLYSFSILNMIYLGQTLF